MATIKEEHQHILGESDFAHNLKLVTSALPAKAHFTSIVIGDEGITVDGEADSSFTDIDYVMALEALEEFSEVCIVRIDEGKSVGASNTVMSPGVSFQVVITK